MKFLAQIFFDVAQIDTTYGDTAWCSKTCLLIAGQETRYNFVLPLHDCNGQSIINALQKLKIMMDKFLCTIYTNFGPKLF